MEVAALWDQIGTETLELLEGFRRRLGSLDVTVKPDQTFLTEADIAVEARIVELIHSADPAAVIVAEEDLQATARDEINEQTNRIWVIDPIDGTAQFIRSGEREFCSVVCLLEDFIPTAALVIAPELGKGATPITISALPAEAMIRVNGDILDAPPPDPIWASVTRSAGVSPRAFEKQLKAAGLRLKTRTTSQTLDMVRVALDIQPYTDLEMPSFALFFREQQKIWDGLAGLCLGSKIGLVNSDGKGSDRVPVPVEVLRQAVPTFAATVMGSPWSMENFLRYLNLEK